MGFSQKKGLLLVHKFSKIVDSDDREVAVTQTEHHIRMTIQKDIDEKWKNRMDREDKVITNNIEALRFDVVEEVVCMRSRHHGSTARQHPWVVMGQLAECS